MSDLPQRKGMRDYPGVTYQEYVDVLHQRGWKPLQEQAFNNGAPFCEYMFLQALHEGATLRKRKAAQP